MFKKESKSLFPKITLKERVKILLTSIFPLKNTTYRERVTHDLDIRRGFKAGEEVRKEMEEDPRTAVERLLRMIHGAQSREEQQRPLGELEHTLYKVRISGKGSQKRADFLDLFTENDFEMLYALGEEYAHDTEDDYYLAEITSIFGELSSIGYDRAFDYYKYFVNRRRSSTRLQDENETDNSHVVEEVGQKTKNVLSDQ